MSQQSSTLHGADRFRIEREIADTLQGRIYAGTDLLENKSVVIKEAWRQLVLSGRSRKGHRVPEDFLKERKLVMSLTRLSDCTPGLVRGIDEWDDEHCYYYAMEYCEGELFDYISKAHTSAEYRQFIDSESKKQQIPMSSPNKWAKDVSKMFKQICMAVQWLHLKGYCHLDLSLENTMISDIANLKVKVIDLGLTQKFNNNNFSFQGRVGKLQYMCPEAYARQVYNAKAADVYCLGVMLFMMLIGAPPYQAPQPQNAAFNYFVSGRTADVLKHWKRLRLITNDALDLLNKMLRYENQRITLDKVLAHPFFTSIEEEKQHANQMQIEEKNNTNNELLVAPTVDNISCDISRMSLEENKSTVDLVENDQEEQEEQEEQDIDVLDNKENVNVNNTNNTNNTHNTYNTYCNMLLQEWGLDDISNILHNTGWSNPKQWTQLTLPVLKFEIGLSEKHAILFINKIKQEFDNNNNNNNNNNMNRQQKHNQCSPHNNYYNNRQNRQNQRQRQQQQQQQQQPYHNNRPNQYQSTHNQHNQHNPHNTNQYNYNNQYAQNNNMQHNYPNQNQANQSHDQHNYGSHEQQNQPSNHTQFVHYNYNTNIQSNNVCDAIIRQ